MTPYGSFVTRDTSLDEISMSFLWISLSVRTHNLDLTLNNVNSFLARGPITQLIKVHCVRPQFSSDRKPVSLSVVSWVDVTDADTQLLSLVSILLLWRRLWCDKTPFWDSNWLLEFSSLLASAFVSSSNISSFKYLESMSFISAWNLSICKTKIEWCM